MFVVLRRQILQIQFAVGAENQPRIELRERDLADAQLEGLQIKLQCIERQCLPAEKILLTVLLHGAEVGDLNAALIIYFRGPAPAAKLSSPLLPIRPLVSRS